MPLIAADGRPVGLLILLTDATGHPSDTGCQVIGQVAQMVAAAIDQMTSIIGLAGLVVDARAAARDGRRRRGERLVTNRRRAHGARRDAGTASAPPLTA